MPGKGTIAFNETGNKFDLQDESIEDSRPYDGSKDRPHFYYRFRHNHPLLNVKGKERKLQRFALPDGDKVARHGKYAREFFDYLKNSY